MEQQSRCVVWVTKPQIIELISESNPFFER